MIDYNKNNNNNDKINIIDNITYNHSNTSNSYR